MAWDTFTSFTQDTGVANSWTTLGDISGSTPGETITVVIGADNESGSVTDSLQVRVLVARDDTPTNYTDEPVFTRTYTPSTVSQEWFAFTLVGFEDYRIQTRSSGAINTYTVDGSWKGNGISV